MRLRLWPPQVRRHEDPPEPWEYPLSRELAIYLCRRRHFEHPFVPRREDVLPEGAFEELHECCGVERLEDLFVVPENMRGTGDGETLLRMPMRILAFGADAVALWVSTYDPPVPVVIPLEHIAAIVDLHQLLYGCLHIRSAAQTLTVRYNTVSHGALREQLLRLRRHLWGRSRKRPVQAESPGGLGGPMELDGDHTLRSLPRKWRLLANSDAVRLRRELSVSLLTENMEEARERQRMKQPVEADPVNPQLAALTEGELVIGTEPPEFNGAYGMRLIQIPREYIERICLGEEPWIDVHGLELSLPISPQLAIRLAESLSRSGTTEVVHA
jgi:hypothetical protein